MADEQRATTSTRLWSEEVAIAAACDGQADLDPTKEPGYEFGNGRKFDSGLGVYANPAD
jgi:hypothetical protein